MGLFKSSKPETYAPPSGPPPSHQIQHDLSKDEYLPPPGPPPGKDQFAPSPGPPPGREQYAPPFGPPPSHTNGEPPPYHDWTVIPDNALLPPPPSMGHDRSPSSNADASDADRAHEWCRFYPLIRPHQPTSAQHAAVAGGEVYIVKPYEYNGDLSMPSKGFWKGSTQMKSRDSCLLSSSPLYFAAVDAPTTATKTIYYELKVRSLGRGRGSDENSIALGYCAMHYPTFRMPGWERGSLAVHSDDGRRYVNDTYGGKDFTSPFRVGDTLGLGMSFSVPTHPPGYGASQAHSINVDIFLTRNGERAESWNLHEELDAKNDLGVDGLDGQYDLYAAIGTFGGAEFDVSFNRSDWLWRPR